MRYQLVMPSYIYTLFNELPRLYSQEVFSIPHCAEFLMCTSLNACVLIVLLMNKLLLSKDTKTL